MSRWADAASTSAFIGMPSRQAVSAGEQADNTVNREALPIGVSVEPVAHASNPTDGLTARGANKKPEGTDSDSCRHCGKRLAWPTPAGIVLADGTAECQRCADDEVRAC